MSKSTKNILLLGDYYKLDQWGMLAYSYLEILASMDINLVCRQIDFGQPHKPEEEWITALENKTANSYDKIIQVCPPKFYNFGPGYTGVFINETSYLSNQDWIRRLNKLPIIVSSYRESANLEASGVNQENIKIVPPYLNPSFLYKTYNFPHIPNYNDGYIFYWVGEYGKRGNYQDVCRAFNAEFDREDNVQLVLYFLETSSEQLASQLYEEINKIKESIGKYRDSKNYKREILKIGKSVDELRSLHHHGNCLVDVAHGGSFSIIAMEAAACGTQNISRNWMKSGYLGETEPIFGSDIYDCNSLWLCPIIDMLRENMRDAYRTNMSEKIDLSDNSLENCRKEMENALSI